MSPLLLDFESHTGLNATQAALLLDVARPTYYQWRRDDRVPGHIVRHIQVIKLLPRTKLADLISEHVYDNNL